MECVFCGIAAGEVDGALVWQDDHSVGFLDHRPLFPGHVLVVPRRHVVTLDELPDEAIGPLFATVRRLSRAVRRALQAQGTLVAMNNVVSQSVLHLHVHVVPRRRGDGLRGFFWPRTPYEDDAHCERVRAAIATAASEA